MRLGIDNLVDNSFKQIRGLNIGLYTNISSCDSRLKPIIAIFTQQKKFKLRAIFTPEHGLYGAVQDQERVRDFLFCRNKKICVYSLYNKTTTPDLNALKKLDALIVDIQDIGARYYTFVWSAIILITEMAKLKKPVIILDRPNPLNGITVQGPVLEKDFSSFVGLYPVPIRHGLTIGEMCNLINQEFNIGAEISIVNLSGWKRRQYFDDLKLYWTPPSPNMPSLETALVYPGMCLLEGTNISEGRGTTRPFEIFGAPWIEPYHFIKSLEQENLPAVKFRPLKFIPTFGKYHYKLCGGAQMYITDRTKFDPIVTGLAVIAVAKKLYPNKFKWRKPPYEFEQDKLPFDILVGNSWIRKAIEQNRTIKDMKKNWQTALNKFKTLRKKYLIYPQ